MKKKMSELNNFLRRTDGSLVKEQEWNYVVHTTTVNYKQESQSEKKDYWELVKFIYSEKATKYKSFCDPTK